MPFDTEPENNGGGGDEPDPQIVLEACLTAIMDILQESNLPSGGFAPMLANVGIHALASAACVRSSCNHRDCFEADLWEMLGRSHGAIINEANRRWKDMHG
jgi:hypothetical protein